ncbi:hypothetical protein D3C86_1383830 [compost metagenome]
MPGLLATWIAAARASWLALPVTKLSNVRIGFRRERSCTVSLGWAPPIGCGWPGWDWCCGCC